MRYLGLFMALALAGCASHPPTYDKPYGTQAQFNQDKGYCKLVAMSAPQQPVELKPSGYVASTTYQAQDVGSVETGQATTTVQPHYGLLSILDVAGTAIGNNKARADTFQACMEAKGYTLRAQR